jgi:HD-GYP domain-containing protein (c-di-GMP phosphodiesterase class II)
MSTSVSERATQGPVAIVPITLEAFRLSMLDCDIYINLQSKNGLTLYRKKGQRVDSSDLERLAARGVHQLYVSFADVEAHRRDVGCQISQDVDSPPATRFALLQEISRASFEAAYHSGDIHQVVNFVGELAPQLTEVLCDSKLVLTDLHALMSHDDCTYTHSINVATYTMLLAKFLGIMDHQHLCKIATGGLLHDVGKRYIDLDVLNKPGKLDDHERRKMSDHPRFGFRDLLPRDDLTWEQLMMVYQHHERYEGGGYPVGIACAEIHPMARVTTIADVFHALTSVRPYRTPMSTNEACTYLVDHSKRSFDPDMVKCWNGKMKSAAGN